MLRSRHPILFAMTSAMVLAKAWNAIVRATAALLLMVMLATPALAEIGCAEESIAHLQGDGDAAQTDGHAVASEQGEPDDERLGGPTGHCGFSHGHCAGIATSNARSEGPAVTVPAYVFGASTPIRGRSLDAPERPPAA